jgi:hypothetical protein
MTLAGAGRHLRERGGGTSGAAISVGARATWGRVARGRGKWGRADEARVVDAEFTQQICGVHGHGDM